MKIDEIGEAGLIKRIWEVFGRENENEDVHFYDLGSKYILLAVDTINERHHFEKGWNPELIGKFLVDINVSDIASKNGKPTEMMASMSFPRNTDETWVIAMIKGMKKELEKYDIVYSGGDLKESPHISLTGLVIGEVEKGKEYRRNGARPGDFVYITHRIGRNEMAIFNYYKHPNAASDDILNITPRVAELTELRKHNVTSCIDNSDGIYKSLSLLASASNVNMRIENNVCDLEVDDEMRKVIYSIGGDYELIFTSPDPIEKFPVIGSVKDGSGVTDIDGSSNIPSGFDHFLTRYHK